MLNVHSMLHAVPVLPETVQWHLDRWRGGRGGRKVHADRDQMDQVFRANISTYALK